MRFFRGPSACNWNDDAESYFYRGRFNRYSVRTRAGLGIRPTPPDRIVSAAGAECRNAKSGDNVRNVGEFLRCPFNGQVYDTVPGSSLFYVRMTVPESARCETPGYPPAAPLIEDDYEEIVVLTPDIHLGGNVLVHRFYVWTTKHYAPDVDMSNQAMFEFPIPVE